MGCGGECKEDGVCVKIADVEKLLKSAIGPIVKGVSETIEALKIISGQIQVLDKKALEHDLHKDDMIGFRKTTEHKIDTELGSAFDRIRELEDESRPRPTCSIIFAGYEETLRANASATQAVADTLETLKKTISSRTWQILILVVMFILSWLGTLIGGIALWFFTR